jgi:hypothetical protein
MSEKIKRLIRNRIQCNHCGDIIESKSVHNFVTCSCGRVSVDGGLDYAKRCFKEQGDYTDLSEWEEVEVVSKNLEECEELRTSINESDIEKFIVELFKKRKKELNLQNYMRY